MKDQILYDRIISRINKDSVTGCWVWNGPSYPWGGDRKRKTVGRYGQLHVPADNARKTRAVHAHRAMWIAVHGDLTRDQYVCHRCDFGLCVNPDHLFIGSAKDNARDMRDKLRNNNSQKTHCPRGHPYAENGVHHGKVLGYYPWRTCKICQVARYRLKYGWPEHLAFDMSIKVPAGHIMDRTTGQIVRNTGQRLRPSGDGT